MSSLAGVEVGQREGKVGGHEETDMGQMWVNRRVLSGRNPGPPEVLGGGPGYVGECVRGLAGAGS